MERKNIHFFSGSHALFAYRTGSSMQIPTFGHREDDNDTKGHPKPELESLPADSTNPKDYLKFLRGNLKAREMLQDAAKRIRDSENNQSPNAYHGDVWREDHSIAAHFIESELPDGPARNAFTDALRIKTSSEPGNEDEYEYHMQAVEAMDDLIGMIDAINQPYITEKRKREREVLKKGTIGEGLRTGVNNFVEAFKEGDGLQKGIMIGMAVAGVRIIIDMWNKPLKEGSSWTWGKLGKLGIAAFLLNQSRAVFKKDRETFMQSWFETGNPIENLKGTLWGGFAIDGHGKDKKHTFEKASETEIMIGFGGIPMKRVLSAYKDARARTGGEFLPEHLYEMDHPQADTMNEEERKTAFLVVDKLVRMTGRNYGHKKRWIRLKENDPNSIVKTEALKGPIDLENWGTQAIQDEYINKPEKHTFEEVMVREMSLMIQIEGGNDPHKYLTEKWAVWENDRTPAKTKKAAKDTADYVGKKAMAGYEIAKRGAVGAYKKVSSWLEKKWDKYYPRAYRRLGLMDRTAKANKFDLGRAEMKPGELDELTFLREDTVILRGVELAFKVDKDGDKTVYKIGGIPLSPDEEIDPQENRKSIKKIFEKAEEVVNNRTKAAGVEGFDDVMAEKDAAGNPKYKIEWDRSSKKWEIKNFEVDGFADLDIDDAVEAVEVEFKPDSTEVIFKIGGQEVKSFKKEKLSTAYRDAEITKEMYNQFPALKGMEVEYEEVKAAPGVGGDVKIKGSFMDYKNGSRTRILDFEFDKNTKGARPNFRVPEFQDNVKLNDDFSDAYVRQIAEDPDFHAPFEALENFITGQSDGIASRIQEAWDQRVFGVVPNVKAAMNGEMVALRATHLLDYKKAEVLEQLKMRLKGKSIKQLEIEKSAIIDSASQRLEEIKKTMEDAKSQGVLGANFKGYIRDIETCNYGNPAYTDLTGEFLDMISDDEFDYQGLDNSEIGNDSHIIYTRLLNRWFEVTKRFSHITTPPDADGLLYMKDTIEVIRNGLRQIQQDSRLKRITKEDIHPNPNGAFK